jgi:hypothetical protein
MLWFLLVLYFHVSNRSRINIHKNVRFEVPKEVLMKMQIFWNVTVCFPQQFKGPSAPEQVRTTII